MKEKRFVTWRHKAYGDLLFVDNFCSLLVSVSGDSELRQTPVQLYTPRPLWAII
jgi:hypothetical protein